MLTFQIMQSHPSSQASSISHTMKPHTSITATHSGQSTPSFTAPYQKQEARAQRHVRIAPIMLSNPVEDSSEDDQSFDEDDMYGSDSGVKTISLAPRSPIRQPSPEEEIVCTSFHFPIS